MPDVARLVEPGFRGEEGAVQREYFWEPVPGCWSVRRRVDGPGPRATFLAGVGD